MVNVFGKVLGKREFYARFGDHTAFAGIIPAVLDSGKATGVKAYRMFTGAGLDFTVLPSRGLDIAWATYNAKSLAYISKTGVVHPRYYESRGIEWLRGFYGGLLTTCGMTYMGAPNTDQGVELGLHGRMSYAEAEDLQIEQKWQDDNILCSIAGKIRESRLFGENILLERKITIKAGENKFLLDDIYENLGFTPEPLQLLYHMNWGYPLLSSTAKLVAPVKKVLARDADAERDDGVKNYSEFSEPIPNFKEQVYFLELATDNKGNTVVALINAPLGIGIYERFNIKQLPYFTEWKCTSESEYVLGLEPGTGTPIGRSKLREQGKMQTIQPGERYPIHIEVGVLSSPEEFKTIKDEIGKLS